MDYDVQHSMNYSIGFVFILLVIVVLIFIFLDFYTRKLLPFKRRTWYLKMEINRAKGRERARWERRLKRHYLRAIPFVGKKLARRVRGKHSSHSK